MAQKPFRSALCIGVIHLSPKKPNSAKRAAARIRFKDGTKSRVYIPGEGHTVQEYNLILVRGGRTKDLPGMKLKVVRGKRDVAPVAKRTTSRSKYGVTKVKNRSKSILYLREKNKIAQGA
jgi:small subunit ribosomal protein S12